MYSVIYSYAVVCTFMATCSVTMFGRLYIIISTSCKDWKLPQNAPESISEHQKSPNFPGGMPPDPHRACRCPGYSYGPMLIGHTGYFFLTTVLDYIHNISLEQTTLNPSLCIVH